MRGVPTKLTGLGTPRRIILWLCISTSIIIAD